MNICSYCSAPTDKIRCYNYSECNTIHCDKCAEDYEIYSKCVKCNKTFCDRCLIVLDDGDYCLKCADKICNNCNNETSNKCSFCGYKLCELCQSEGEIKIQYNSCCDRYICYNYSKYEDPRCEIALDKSYSECSCSECGM